MYRALRVIELLLWAQGESIRTEIEAAKGDASVLLLSLQDVDAGIWKSRVICFATQWQLEFAAAQSDIVVLMEAGSANQLKVRLSSFGKLQMRKCHTF